MGTLEHIDGDLELENALKLECIEPEIIAKIEDAVRVLLQGLGEDVNRVGIIKTPNRVAKALLYSTQGYKQSVEEIVEGALFPESGFNDNKVIGNAGGVGGLVIVRDLNLFSYCESCLLPFHVKGHVGYVPSGERVVGLSKLSRVSDVFAKRLQDPQRLADEICSALQRTINPDGVAVLLECSHILFPNSESWHHLEGWKKIVTYSRTGVFSNDVDNIWSEFLNLLKHKASISDVDNNDHHKGKSYASWCPSLASVKGNSLYDVGKVEPDMINAVTSIIKSLGEYPLRKELARTPIHFVKWLLDFQTGNIDIKQSHLNSISSSTGEIIELTKKNMNVELSLPFWSQCEHHLLPFYGVVHIGYFVGDGLCVIDKGVLQSIVHFYGFKLQVQERFTRQVAEIVGSMVGGDVIVVAEASHTCMITRGVEKFGSSTTTIAVLGRFSTDAAARALFLDGLPTHTSWASLA